MNPTIIKEWWLASWEVKIGLIAMMIAGLTAGDIAPYIVWMPDWIESLVAQYWGFITMGIMWLLRITKTSTKLVMFKKDADAPEVVAAAKAELKKTPVDPEIIKLRAEIEELRANSQTTAAADPKA